MKSNLMKRWIMIKHGKQVPKIRSKNTRLKEKKSSACKRIVSVGVCSSAVEPRKARVVNLLVTRIETVPRVGVFR